MLKFVALAAVIASVAVANATPIGETFSLNTSQDPALGAGPFGTVTLMTVGSDVQVGVTLATGMGFANINAGDALDFYINSPGLTITGLTSGFSALPFGTYKGGPARGFDYAISCDAACGTTATSTFYTGSLDFLVSNVTLADFALSPGARGGFYFASTICDGTSVNRNNVTKCNGDPGATGPVTAAEGVFINATAVPEPLTLSIFGAGLFGAAAMRRRKKNA